MVLYLGYAQWFLPFLTWYVDTVHCHTPLGLPGIVALWYGLFVGLPIICALFLGIFTVPIGIKSFCSEQFPPPGMKVFKPTKIRFGWQAKTIAFIHVFIPMLLLLVSFWGYFQVGEMPTDDNNFDYRVCKDISQ
ncbi:hypothetical protein [Thalassotalea ganghwensis]